MAKHPFLSEAWINEARKIRDEHAGEVPTPPLIRMNLVVTNAPFDNDTVQAHVDTSSGSLELEQGHLERPDVTVSTDYATTKALFVEQNPAAAMQAFMEGRIRVQGDLSKLMALQAGAPSGVDDMTREVARKIKAITAD
jgi:hypothetical protein